MIRRATITLCIFLSCTQYLQAQGIEISDPRIRDIANAITQICHVPSRRGDYWEVRVAADGNATVRLIGLGAEANLSRGEWNGVREVLTPEGQVSDRQACRNCVEKLAPLFLEKFASVEANRTGHVNLVGRWISPDGLFYWVIRPGMSGRYSIEEYFKRGNRLIGDGMATVERNTVNFTLNSHGNFFDGDTLYLRQITVNGILEYKGDRLIGHTDELDLMDESAIVTMTMLRAN